MSNPRIIISGGGTGGHIFPALSIADSIKAIEPQAEILFVGAEGRVKVTVRDWKKNDGTTEQQNQFKYLPPAVDDDEERPF